MRRKSLFCFQILLAMATMDWIHKHAHNITSAWSHSNYQISVSSSNDFIELPVNCRNMLIGISEKTEKVWDEIAAQNAGRGHGIEFRMLAWNSIIEQKKIKLKEHFGFPWIFRVGLFFLWAGICHSCSLACLFLWDCFTLHGDTMGTSTFLQEKSSI